MNTELKTVIDFKSDQYKILRHQIVRRDTVVEQHLEIETSDGIFIDDVTLAMSILLDDLLSSMKKLDKNPPASADGQKDFI